MSAERVIGTKLRFEQRRLRPVVGLTFLLPGAPQWLWQQRERSMLLFGSFATSLVIGLFTWGTRTSLALMIFAYFAHVASAADAIRQWSFPGFSRWIPTFSASACLGFGCYGPLLLIGSVIAWPGHQTGSANAGYLIDRSAYRGHIPESGDRIWLCSGRADAEGRLAQVVAKAGQNVEWTSRGLRVNGRRLDLIPFRSGEAPLGLEFQVPDGLLLISCRAGDPSTATPWEFVPITQVDGRAWAKLYPVWERHLLP